MNKFRNNKKKQTNYNKKYLIMSHNSKRQMHKFNNWINKKMNWERSLNK